MTKLPALIKALRGTTYHIADHADEDGNGHITRCGRRMNALVETYAIAVGWIPDADARHCAKCGTLEDFEQINSLRDAEQAAEKAEHKRQLTEIDATRASRNAVRPALTEAIMGVFANIASAMSDPDREPELKPYSNMDLLRVPIMVNGQQFTIKIEIWNGDHQ